MEVKEFYLTRLTSKSKPLEQKHTRKNFYRQSELSAPAKTHSGQAILDNCLAKFKQMRTPQSIEEQIRKLPMQVKEYIDSLPSKSRGRMKESIGRLEERIFCLWEIQQHLMSYKVREGS